MSTIDSFEKLLAAGQDSALLRYSLGSAYYKDGQLEPAIAHLVRAVEQDPGYSAAWKMYGKALADAGRLEEAEQVYTRGIAVAEDKGDLQAAKEMQVFLKRVKKARPG
ncbi:MAG: tetratricopeptide repeat protein [Gammaproteobacteria bacterium]|jgi:tetratricopeptide (TPR) repeat protein